MEPVFRTLEIAAEVAVTITGTAIIYQGLEHLPQAGGAVVALDQTELAERARRQAGRD